MTSSSVCTSRLKLLLAAAPLYAAVVMIFQAATSSPLFDEAAHIASGLKIVRDFDFGYYCVNPPLPRLLSAVAVDAVVSPRMPPAEHSRTLVPSARPEFDLGTNFLKQNPDKEYSAIVVGRIIRIPFVITGWLLLSLFFNRYEVVEKGVLLTLWSTSPLVLSQGWVVSADALSSVAMILIVLAQLNWMKRGSWHAWLYCGLAWAFAICTKFTFLPLFLLAPVALSLFWVSQKRGRRFAFKNLWLTHYAQLVVMFPLIALSYGFTDMATIAQDLCFESDLLTAINTKAIEGTWLATVPLPLPMAFITGIDTQLADMDYPRGGYILGKSLSGSLWWFYFAGYPIKEQVATLSCFLIAPFFLGRINSVKLPPERAAAMNYVLGMCCLVFFALSSHGNLAWNLRYLSPALPLLYILAAGVIGIALRRARYGQKRVLLVLFVCASFVESVVSFPNYYSYANPIFGGTFRVPNALHDSNFDYGQDVWRVRNMLAKLEAKGDSQIRAILLGPGVYNLDLQVTAVEVEDVERAIRTVESEIARDGARNDLLIVPRILIHPEPWHTREATQEISAELRFALRRLLMFPPEYFLTPTYSAYRIPSTADFD